MPNIPTTFNLNKNPNVNFIILKSISAGFMPALIDTRKKFFITPSGSTKPNNSPKAEPINNPRKTIRINTPNFSLRMIDMMKLSELISI